MKKRARSLAAKKGWRTRRAHQRARSLAAKKGAETRRRNRLKRGRQQRAALAKARRAKAKKAKAVKATRKEWAITYDYGEKASRFTGELRFTSPKHLTEREANNMARSILKGKIPEGTYVEYFEYRGREATDDAREGKFAFAAGWATSAARKART